ncbi:hypothetical protein ACSTS3_17560 [Aquimarina muelleri]|uniref:hypothetical protein n=1 Tax=Aquimarina muelleri TaxID=279356 RepID=UPI003F6893B6
MILVNRNNILVGNVIHKYIEWIVKLNFAAVICQALFPKIVFRFFMELYYQPSLEVYKHALEHFEAHGWIPRVFGWFGSPIDLGAIMLLCWAYFIHIIITNNKKGNIVLALMIIITGVSPLSKTFLIGAPIISLFYLLYIISNGISKRLFVKVAKFMIFTTSSFVLLYLILLQTFIGPYVKYYFKFIFDPLSSLSARYAAKGDELFLNTTYEVIKENWISGVGPSAIRGEFVGDSEYVTIIHNTGIIGFIIFLILIFFLIAKFIIKKNIMCMLVLIALLLVSIGGMTFYFSTICLPFIFFLLFNQQHKLLKTS